MRHALHKSFVLKACLWRNSTRGIASEPVVQCHSGADRNSTLGQRWLEHENEVLLKAIQKQEHLIEKAENPSAESHRRLKWEEIETFCHSEGIFRSAEQCRNRWQRLLNAFNRVKSWESCRSPTKTSFWAMKASDRKSGGLPPTFDRSTFDFIDLIQNRKDISRSMVASAAGEEATAENPSSEKLDNHDCSKQCAESQHTRESDHLEAKRFAGENLNECICGYNDELNTAAVRSTQEELSSGDDDREPMLVRHYIKECLSYLKDLDYSSHNAENATKNECNGVTMVNYADVVVPNSTKSSVPVDSKNA